MRKALSAVAIAVCCAACGQGAKREQAQVSRETSRTSAALPTSPAESLYFRGEYDSAAAKWRAELASWLRKNDSLKQANALMWLGLTAWRQGDNGKARELGEQSLSIKRKLSGNTDISRSYNALGLVARDEGRLREAAQLFDSAVAAARSVSDTAGVSRAAANVALIDLEFGEFDKARRGFEAARDAGRALGDKRVEGNALNNLGMLSIRLGDVEGAIPLINDALERYRAIDYKTGEQNSLAQLATAYDVQGEPERALLLLDSALKLARAGNMRTEEASNLRLIGQAYQTVEDHRRALGYLSQAIALSTELGLAQERATALRSEAESHLALGNVALARERMRGALAVHRGENALWEELGDELTLAELAAVARDDRDADARMASAERIAGKLNVPSALNEVTLTRARIAAFRERWRDVLRLLERKRESGSTRRGLEWEPLALRARAFGKLGYPDSAVSAGRRAIAAAERVRGRIASAGLRTGFTAARAEIYADQVLALLELGRSSEAFEVADAARGRALVEHLSLAKEGVARSASTAGNLARGEVLLRQIDELIQLLEDAERAPESERYLDERAVESISARVTMSEREYSSLVETATARDPVRTTLLGVKTIHARDVQKLLRPDEALVEYLVSGNRILAFVVRARGVGYVELGSGDSAIARRTRIARELLQRRGSESRETANALAELHAILLGPIGRSGMLAGVRRLVIVPHSSLSYLPFSALRDEGGRYVAEKYSVLTLPSAGAFAALRSNARGNGEDASAAVFAPFTQRLPATKLEARSVKSSIGGTSALLDDDASEAAFRESIAANRVLHLATHGTLNAQNPLFSRIELARSRAKGNVTSSDDGHLAVHELIGMRAESPLVFLSGCETGLGSLSSSEFAKGEDYATLSQALLYSGARSTVATLWRIDDESAAVFARHFYRHLRHLPPPEALAAAQQNMLIDPRYREPYHWAAYQVAGGGDRIPLKKRWWDLFAR